MGRRNFRDHVPGDVPSPDNRQPAPSTYMTLMYNIHYTLSTTNYHAPTGTWVVHGIDSLLPAYYAPSPHNLGPDITPERTSLTTPTSRACVSAGPWTPTPPRPTTLQLCPYMVAACLMALLWPGPDTPSQSYLYLTEEDMPGIQRCFFSTLDYLQQTHPHVLELKWTPPG